MEEENQQLLRRPLLHPCSALEANHFCDHHHHTSNHITKLASSSPGIISRLIFLVFVGAVSVWANYEASKGLDIGVINEAGDTPSGKRFALFYVSNDEISRLVLSSSQFVENILYPKDDSFDSDLKKQVSHVTIRLQASRNDSSSNSSSDDNNNNNVIVDYLGDHRYVLRVSPSVMEEKDFRETMFLAVQKGMTRVWLWDGDGNAPSSLVNGIIDYIGNLALSDRASSRSSSGSSGNVEGAVLSRKSWWKESSMERETWVAEFLKHCEGQSEGFIRRLNRDMKNGWRDQMLDDALGFPIQLLCGDQNSSHCGLVGTYMGV